MKTTRYFEKQVLRKRPEIDPAWWIAVIAAPLQRHVQADGRIRYWGEILRPGEPAPRILRVSLLSTAKRFTTRSSIVATGRRTMKLHYYPETDSLYIERNAAPSAETREVADGVNVDLDSDGRPVGFDIDHASSKLDLSTLETSALPFRTIKAA